MRQIVCFFFLVLCFSQMSAVGVNPTISKYAFNKAKFQHKDGKFIYDYKINDELEPSDSQCMQALSTPDFLTCSKGTNRFNISIQDDSISYIYNEYDYGERKNDFVTRTTKLKKDKFNEYSACFYDYKSISADESLGNISVYNKVSELNCFFMTEKFCDLAEKFYKNDNDTKAYDNFFNYLLSEDYQSQLKSHAKSIFVSLNKKHNSSLKIPAKDFLDVEITTPFQHSPKHESIKTSKDFFSKNLIMAKFRKHALRPCSEISQSNMWHEQKNLYAQPGDTSEIKTEKVKTE